jgi:hypothetical protein
LAKDARSLINEDRRNIGASDEENLGEESTPHAMPDPKPFSPERSFAGILADPNCPSREQDTTSLIAK